jgi:chorismate dehydratase
MMRVGAVGFLNARPLVHALLDESWCSVRFDVPSTCARLLHAGEIDLGLVPTIELVHGPQPYEIVPGPAIACRGPVDSVALFTEVPVAAIRTIALDTSSRASATLLRVLCAHRFGIAPRFIESPPDLRGMLAHADAGLLIGDPALEAPWQDLGLEKIDLGQAWYDLTGLPFVFAVWACRPGVLSVQDVARVQAARQAGLECIASIAAEHAGGDTGRQAEAERYLRERIRYDLDADAVRGLERYLLLARDLGLAPGERWQPRWAGSSRQAPEPSQAL